MRRNVIFCDRCGAVIKEFEFDGDLAKSIPDEPADMVIFAKSTVFKGQFAGDFCTDCTASFAEWFGKPIPGMKYEKGDIRDESWKTN